MKELLEDFAEKADRLISDDFGSTFAWDNNVGTEWRTGKGDRPFTTNPEERYLLMTLWDVRHEANDVLHYLTDATNEDIQELLDLR
jgi:hypothetical protein